MNTSQIKELTKYCLDECGAIGNGGPNHYEVKVLFNNRLRRTVAQAQNFYGVYGVIEISSKWWNVLPADRQENVVVHEACHLAAKLLDPMRVIREGLQGHGDFWASLHRKCGREPERFCSYAKESGISFRSTYEILCENCGKKYNVTKTLITRRMNRTGGSIGQCSCKNKLYPPKQYFLEKV